MPLLTAGGGILWRGATPVEYTHFMWADHTIAFLSARRDNTSQTVFEFLCVYLSLHTFSRSAAGPGVLVGGDNFASLQNALDCGSGKPAMNLIGREIASRQALRGWHLKAVHFPK